MYIPHGSLIFHSYFSYLPNRFLLIFSSLSHPVASYWLFHTYVWHAFCIITHQYFRFSSCSISIFARLIHKLVMLFNIPSTLFFASLLMRGVREFIVVVLKLHMLKKRTTVVRIKRKATVATWWLTWVEFLGSVRSHRLFFTAAFPTTIHRNSNT